MRGRKLNLEGKKFNRLTVVGLSENQPVKGRRFWVCECDCGNITELVGYDISSGRTKSCGCYQKDGSKLSAKHGMSRSPTYASWIAMKVRCYSENSVHYEYYGGRGIKVCERWLESFENFFEDMGERPEGMTLNRIRDAEIYSKETCEWASKSVQGFDQRRSSDNTSGKTGVRWDKNGQKWVASISFEKEVIHIGRYINFEDACEARDALSLELYGYTKD